MNADTINRRDPTGSFRFAGAGLTVGRQCWGCNGRFTDTRGGAPLGKLKLWHCAGCVAKRKAAA